MPRMESFTEEDLTVLMTMQAEMSDLPDDADYSAYSPDLVRVTSDFEDAIAEALLEFDPKTEVFDEPGWALDVYLTIMEHGAGIWDGRWERYYNEADIAALQRFLKLRLRSWAESSGTGTFNEAIANEAYAIGEDDDGEL